MVFALLFCAYVSSASAAMFPIATNGATQDCATDGSNFLCGVESHLTTPATIGAQLINSGGGKVGSFISTGRQGIATNVAFDGTNYLLIWEDNGVQLYGQFISAAGAVVGSPFAITGQNIFFDANRPMAFGGGNYLVTYTRMINPLMGDSSTNRYIAGRFISPNGSMGSEFRISTGYGAGSEIAFDGTNFFVIWREDSADTEVRGRFVGTDGTLGAEISVNASAAPSDNPMSVAFDGTNYLVLWNDEVSSGNWDLFAQRVSKAGTLVGDVITVTNEAGPQFIPTAAFDGTNYLIAWVDRQNDANQNGTCDSGEGTCWNIYGQYLNTSGVPVGSKLSLNTDAGNQTGGVKFANGRYMLIVNNGVVMGQGGFSQIEGSYGSFIVPSTPTISAFIPASAKVGATVTVSGYNLSNPSVVTIGGVTATVTPINSTSLSIVIPANAVSGAIRITTPSGQAVSDNFFTVLPNTLTVNLPGSGSGSVNATSGVSLSCSTPSTSCTADVAYGTSITLAASASVGSTFSGWSGACTGSTCTFSMAGDKVANADFTLQQNLKINTIYYGTLQSALNVAANGNIIQIRAIKLPDSGVVTFSRTGVTATLKGGYDSGFANRTGYSSLDAVLSLVSGRLIVDRLIIY